MTTTRRAAAATGATIPTTPAVDAQAQAPDASDELAMGMLGAGIPLTLVLDLAESFGPPSAEILATEDPEAGDWLHDLPPVPRPS